MCGITLRLAKLTLGAAALALSACGGLGLGADGIARGRSVYNEVINRTDDEQTLQLIVRTRYGLTSGLLQVKGVTANMKFAARMTAQFPIGADKYSLGNLVPLETGVAFEENPTISYVPLRGSEATFNMLSPISPRTLVLGTLASGRSKELCSLLVERLNGLPHPALGQPGGERFERAVSILIELLDAGVADWGRRSGAEDLELVVFGYRQHREQVAELFELLSLAPPPADGRDVPLPLLLAVGSPDGRSIQVRTRSVYDLVRIAAASIDVPAAHAEADLVAPLPRALEAMSGAMRVKTSVDAPDHAMVAVPHDGYWYYIERTDHRSKLFFRIIQRLFEIRLADTQSDHATPVMTIPVN